MKKSDDGKCVGLVTISIRRAKDTNKQLTIAKIEQQ